MSYITKQEIKKYLGITWTTGLDSFIDTLISSAEKFVEEFCGDSRFGKRSFEAPDPDDDVTKYFNGNDEQRLYIGDLRELTSLTVDGELLTENTDFYTYPLNAVTEEKPIIAIELVQHVFELLQRSVVVVGKWGYSETPPSDVAVVIMKIVGGIIKENIGDSDLKEVTQESLGEYGTSYVKVREIAHGLGIASILKPYKRKINGSNRIVKVS